MIMLNSLKRVPPIFLIRKLEQIKCFFIDSMESFMNVFPIVFWKPASLIEFLGFFDDVVGVVEVKAMLFDGVEDVVNLCNYYTV